MYMGYLRQVGIYSGGWCFVRLHFGFRPYRPYESKCENEIKGVIFLYNIIYNSSLLPKFCSLFLNVV